MNERELVAASMAFCREAGITLREEDDIEEGKSSCAYNVAALVLVFLGRENTRSQVGYLRDTTGYRRPDRDPPSFPIVSFPEQECQPSTHRLVSSPSLPVFLQQPGLARAIAKHLIHQGRHREACLVLDKSLPGHVEPLVLCLEGQGKQSEALGLLLNHTALLSCGCNSSSTLSPPPPPSHGYERAWSRLLSQDHQALWAQLLLALSLPVEGGQESCSAKSPWWELGSCLKARALAELGRWGEARRLMAEMDSSGGGGSSLCREVVALMLDSDPQLKRRKYSTLPCR